VIPERSKWHGSVWCDFLWEEACDCLEFQPDENFVSAEVVHSRYSDIVLVMYAGAVAVAYHHRAALLKALPHREGAF